MRRHFGSCAAQRRAAEQRNGLTRRAPRLWWSGARTGIEGTPAKCGARGRPGHPQGGHHQGDAVGRGLHAGTRTHGVAPRGSEFRQGIRQVAGHPAHRRQSPAGACHGALHQGERRRYVGTAHAVPLPARERRQLADSKGQRLQQHGGARTDHRRCRRRGHRQMLEGDGTGVSRRTYHRPPGPAGKPTGIYLLQPNTPSSIS